MVYVIAPILLCGLAPVQAAAAQIDSRDWSKLLEEEQREVQSVRLKPVSEEARCLEQIRQAVCLVVDVAGWNPPCLPESARYEHYFVQLYAQYPSYLQKMMCHVRKIIIGNSDSGASAAAGLYRERDDGPVLGGFLYVRRSLLDGSAGLQEWASWKEQLSFGADPNHISVRSDLPIVRTSLSNGKQELLLYLVTHELGHLFDYANSLNGSGADSWHQFSWQADRTAPLPSSDFPLRRDLCFYACAGHDPIPTGRQDELYRTLLGTNFLTPYSSTNAVEDFGETFAYYVLWKERHVKFEFQTASGTIYPISERLETDPLLASKRRFIEKFLASSIKYPGDVP